MKLASTLHSAAAKAAPPQRAELGLLSSAHRRPAEAAQRVESHKDCQRRARHGLRIKDVRFLPECSRLTCMRRVFDALLKILPAEVAIEARAAFLGVQGPSFSKTARSQTIRP